MYWTFYYLFSPISTTSPKTTFSIYCLSIRFSIVYTYASKSSISGSHIDYFVLSEGLCDSVDSYSVLHDNDNFSDYDVVSLKLTISVTHNTLDISMIDKLLWYKATHSQLIKYQNNLDRLLCKCNIPDHVFQSDDVFCDVHNQFIPESHVNIVKACLLSLATQRKGNVLTLFDIR